MSGLSEDRRLWREGEIGVVGPREQSKCGGSSRDLGQRRAGEKWNPFSWDGTPGGRGTSRIRVSEQDSPSSGMAGGTRPGSWVLVRPRRA